MEDIWLAHAKHLQAIASTGLHYGLGEHDRERYAELADKTETHQTTRFD